MKKELIAQRSPKSPIAETFRTLRTVYEFTKGFKNNISNFYNAWRR